MTRALHPPALRGATSPDVPTWVHACDLLVVVLVTSAIAVAITGGVRERLADGLMLSLRSPWRPLLLAAAIAVVRHGLVRRPSMHERLADGFTRVWRVVAHVAWPALHLAAVALFLVAVSKDYRPIDRAHVVHHVRR